MDNNISDNINENINDDINDNINDCMNINIDINMNINMDIKQFYIEKGQGNTLMLLHGNGESCEYFKHQIDVFSQFYHVYAIDTRGHGGTPRGNKPFTICQFAEDLAYFMDLHTIKKAHILGFSDGGNIAMIFAIRYPDRVDKLILNGANMNPEGVKRFTQLPIEIGYRIAKSFASVSDKARAHAEMLGLMVNEPDISAQDLSYIKAKTLVIAGTRDMIKEKHTRLIANYISGAELAFIKGSHFVANENPEMFNKRVLEFLRKI